MTQTHSDISNPPEKEFQVDFFEKMLAFFSDILYNNFVACLVYAGVMELVDVVDSKSTDGDIVPVRVRPPAPN